MFNNCDDIIQFEYGETYADADIKFIDVIKYLSDYFYDFSYLDSNKLVRIQDYTEHVCFNNKNRKI